MKRTIAFVIAILVGFVFASGAALGEPKKNKPIGLEVSVVVSNGEKISGKLIRVNSNRVFIRRLNKSGSGKNISVFKANISEIVPLGNNGEKSDEKDVGKIDDAAKAMEAGREFLKLNRPALANIAFNIAIQRNANLGKAIRQIYTDTGKKAPKEFQEPSSNNSKKSLRLFLLPTPAQIESCMEKANRWGKKMKKISPKTHTIKTDHFIIYSAWSRRDDRKLSDIYEKLYRTLCKQLDRKSVV